MKYYRDAQGRVYAYEEDGSQDAFIPATFTYISLEEANLLRFPPATPAQNKTAALLRINTAYEAAIVVLNGDYPDSEIQSWPTQDAEASALLADKNADTPWLKGASKGRNVPIDNLVVRVKKKANQYLPAYGELTGKRQRLRDAIDALGDSPTLSQLDAIQW